MFKISPEITCPGSFFEDVKETPNFKDMNARHFAGMTDIFT